MSAVCYIRWPGVDCDAGTGSFVCHRIWHRNIDHTTDWKSLMYEGDYIHLHCHSQYSLMDGLCSPAELLTAAKTLGHTAMAITDHGTVVAHREMQREAERLGIKPILGVEAYISETDRFDKRAVKKRDDNTSVFNHIILLAKNANGVVNLNKLSEIAWTEGFYHKPRIDLEVLDEYGDDIIVLSGCMNGLLAKAYEREQPEKARQIAGWFKNRFENDFYVEIQPHNPQQLNHQLLDLADDLGLSSVVTSDCHFATETQRALEEVMLILATKPTINSELDRKEAESIENIFDRLNYLYPDRPISFEQIDVFVQGRADAAKTLANQGIEREDVFENTLAIADKVGDYAYHKDLNLLPQPKTDAAKRLRTLSNAGLKRLGVDKDERYIKRLDMELNTINEKGFSSYFLIQYDAVTWARSKDIFVGPGRGSAAGSLVCYALDITQIDPIENGLLFARFINEERNDFPDIDTDFQDDRRGEVKAYMTRKFKHVAGISTYSYFRDKGVIKDVSRVFYVPLAEVNKALKPVETFEDFEKNKATAPFRKKYPEVLKYAKQLRGRIRSNGAHPAGLIVAKDSISNYAPLETRSDKHNKVNERVVVAAYDMDSVAEVGLIKFDFLGLKTLTVIKEALDMIKQRHDKDVDLVALPLDDSAVFSMISAGFTKGIFQAEQGPYTALIAKMGIHDFVDLSVSNALVRPGAMNTVGKTYMNRKAGREQVKYKHDILEEITKETYGVIIYQEQVMQACVKLAGMSWSDADRIRKIIGKKKDVSEFDEFKERFVEGASRHVSVKQAESLWHDFEAHADYSFNKSHAVAYSMVSYWTAWLKYYYPHEYMCALLRSEADSGPMTDYLIEAKRLGINVLLPHVNKSQANFSLEGNSIRFGLGKIKGISVEKGALRIMAHAPYASYAQLQATASQTGSGINTKMLGSLNAVGAAAFDDNPLSGYEADNYYEYLNIPKFKTAALPPSIMSRIQPLTDFEEKGCSVHLAMVKQIKRGTGWSRVEFIDESGTMGVFHKQHTTIETGQMYLILVADNRIARFIPIDDVEARLDDAFVRFLAADELKLPDNKWAVIAFNPLKSKAGKPYAHVVLADSDREMVKVMVFAKQYPHALTYMQPGAAVKLELGRLKDDTLFVEGIDNGKN